MIISLKNISISFKSQDDNGPVKVLSDYNLSITKPGIYCILGKSGIGKTTLINVIASLVKPDKGEVEVAPLGVSYSFQEQLLLPWLSVKENLLLVLSSDKQLSQREKTNKIKKLLKYFQIESKINSYPHELSGGQKQRVNIIRSFLRGSGIVLMDEPFTFLDKKIRKLLSSYINDYVRRLQAVVVITSHQISPELKHVRKVMNL